MGLMMARARFSRPRHPKGGSPQGDPPSKPIILFTDFSENFSEKLFNRLTISERYIKLPVFSLLSFYPFSFLSLFKCCVCAGGVAVPA